MSANMQTCFEITTVVQRNLYFMLLGCFPQTSFISYHLPSITMAFWYLNYMMLKSAHFQT